MWDASGSRRNAHSAVAAAAVCRRCWQLLFLVAVTTSTIDAYGVRFAASVAVLLLLQRMMMLRLRLEASRRDAHDGLGGVASVVASRRDATPTMQLLLPLIPCCSLLRQGGSTQTHDGRCAGVHGSVAIAAAAAAAAAAALQLQVRAILGGMPGAPVMWSKR